MVTLSGAILVNNEESIIEDCIMSLIGIVDELIIVFDPKSIDKTKEIITELAEKEPKIKIIMRKYKFSKQYIYDQCSMDWVLFLDSDEVLSDNAYLIKDYINNKEIDMINIRSHHFIYSLGQEDATVDKHYHVARLIRKASNVSWVGKNHSLPKWEKQPKYLTINDVRIYHLGYIKHLYRIMEKHHRDIKIKQLHDDKFLYWWKDAHLLGKYPIKPFDISQLPERLKRRFKL